MTGPSFRQTLAASSPSCTDGAAVAFTGAHDKRTGAVKRDTTAHQADLSQDEANAGYQLDER